MQNGLMKLISPEQNKYYDIHYFFNTLTRKGFINNFWNDELIPIKIKEFINRVVPEKYKKGDLVSERGRLLDNIEYTTADKLIKYDPLFNIMRYQG